jgi:serine/threonine protein phosphatase 1
VATTEPDKFSVMTGARRVWAVGAIHGERQRLTALHGAMEARFQPGDRLVYLGNYIGLGPDITGTLDELLLFRRALMARFTLFDGDIVHLRGAQEEMWQKLLQIQIAQDPAQILEWMLAQGVDATLAAYGINADAVRMRCREGPLALARWSVELRESVRAHPGHETLFASLRRAAFTADHALLFVHAGVDPARPLAAQSDAFWWGSGDFDAIETTVEGFRRIVRGYDPAQGGPSEGAIAMTIDTGCGHGGKLTAVCLDANGEVQDAAEA